ncbi:MAG TPA: hypothetical protein PLI95_26590 [Polyangiaceae bacterium]|nr:hypothetical protein [Polyangiaceae bacterium]
MGAFGNTATSNEPDSVGIFAPHSDVNTPLAPSMSSTIRGAPSAAGTSFNTKPPSASYVAVYATPSTPQLTRAGDPSSGVSEVRNGLNSGSLVMYSRPDCV